MDKLIILCFAVFLVGLVAGAGHESNDDEHHEDQEESECMQELRECKESYNTRKENNPNTIDEHLKNLQTYYGCVEKAECYDDDRDVQRKGNVLFNIGIDIETTPPITTCAERIKECWIVFEERTNRDFLGFISCMKNVKERSDVCTPDSMKVVVTLLEASEDFLDYLTKPSLCPGCSDTACADGLNGCRNPFVAGNRDDMELELLEAFHTCVEGVMCAADHQIHQDNLRTSIENMLMAAKKALYESPMCDPSIDSCKRTYMEYGQNLDGTRNFRKCVTETFCPGERGIAGKIQLLVDIREKIQSFKVVNHASFMKPTLVTMTLTLILALLFK